MASLPLLTDDRLAPEARAVFDEIRAARGTDYVNNFWRGLAHDPALLRATWDRLRAVMAPGALDPLVKELLYVAVSTANGCGYCVHSHTAAAKAKGMTPAMHAELLAVIAMAAQTNALATAMQTPVDDVFLADR
jgi:AhpD family alkylhydroperoxidase